MIDDRIQRFGGSVAPFVALALVARLAFWALAGRVWEDALITVAHARNLVLGNGLVHHLGEPPVHGFTSALSVLIPIPGELVDPGGGGIVALRLASLVAVVIAIVYADRITRRIGLSAPARIVVLTYLALDQNQVFYGMAGMETQVAVAILLASVWYVLSRDPLRAGVSLGLVLLARPDLVLWVVPAVVGLAIWSRRGALIAGAVGALVVAPWMVFTALYYGSPIPHTILAKSAVLVAPPTDLADWGPWVLDQVATHLVTVDRTFAPFLEDTLATAAPVPAEVLWLVASAVFILAGIGAWRTRRVPGWGPAVVFVAGFGVYRLLLVPVQYYDWYVPPFTTLAILLVGAGVDGLIRSPRPRAVLAVALALAFALPLPFSIGLEGRIQREIEAAVRQPAGLYLRAAVRPGETVSAESVGYLGYYSRATFYDYPGLTSAVALDALLPVPRPERTLSTLIDRLRPSWIVLRPAEQASLEEEYPETAARYQVCARFAAPGVGAEIDWGGYAKWTIDSVLIVLHAGGCPAGIGAGAGSMPRSTTSSGY